MHSLIVRASSYKRAISAPPPNFSPSLPPNFLPPFQLPQAMVKSMTIAGQVPHFHYCDEVQASRAA
jgi:hypothetical protein